MVKKYWHALALVMTTIGCIQGGESSTREEWRGCSDNKQEMYYNFSFTGLASYKEAGAFKTDGIKVILQFGTFNRSYNLSEKDGHFRFDFNRCIAFKDTSTFLLTIEKQGFKKIEKSLIFKNFWIWEHRDGDPYPNNPQGNDPERLEISFGVYDLEN